MITTAPTVVYRVTTTKGEILEIDNPAELPPPNSIDGLKNRSFWRRSSRRSATWEPFFSCVRNGGDATQHPFSRSARVMISYEMPLERSHLDFYDKLKSRTQGYASLDYELLGYRESDLVKLDILLNGEAVTRCLLLHKERAYARGRQLAEKMKELIPRQMFEIAIQAAIGNKVIARETIGAMKKNVTAKCYGGDITRKRKLLEKQKEGKKRMKAVGSVEVPQEAFLAILKVGQRFVVCL